MTTSAPEKHLIEDVQTANDTLTVRLVDGRTISTPLAWYPRLLEASEEERDDWELIGGGIGVHWPQIDEDLSLAGMLRGVRAPAPRQDRYQQLAQQSAQDFFVQSIRSLKAQIQNYRDQLEQYAEQLPEGDLQARIQEMTASYYELEGSIDQAFQEKGNQNQGDETAESTRQYMAEFAEQWKGVETEMPDENVYDVSPRESGWGVERRGASRASGRFDTKEQAVQRGRELAKGQKGRLVIRKQDGTIQEERTYRKDPYPPPG
jgi:hypothetical protein